MIAAFFGTAEAVPFQTTFSHGSFHPRDCPADVWRPKAFTI
jgi:hypothetical protein